MLPLLTTFAVMTSAAPPRAAAAAGSNVLQVGESLRPGQHLYSAGGVYDLVLQSDGNLVLYWRGRAVWHTGTGGRAPSQLIMQGDGNLVLYATTGPVWWSGGTGQAGTLYLQDDGNLVVYSAGRASWSSATANPRWSDGDEIRSSDGRHRAVMQADGNFVLYSPTKALWATYTGGQSAFLTFQPSGNLVLYNATGVVLWQSGTCCPGRGQLIVGNDGNMTITAPSGATIWATNTSSNPSSGGAYITTDSISPLLELLNNYRASIGLARETYSDALAANSRACALGMASSNAPLAHCQSNEIIQYNTNSTPQVWFQAWLNSPPHKALIDSPSNRLVGAGSAYNPSSGRYYIVMNFA